MAKARPVNDSDGRFYGIRFNCPGCAWGNFPGAHILPVHWCPPGREPSAHNAGHAHWGFNGDMDRPTFTPSILSTQNRGDMKFVCHSFITDGNIQFLADCTHELAGKTIPLPDLEPEVDEDEEF